MSIINFDNNYNYSKVKQCILFRPSAVEDVAVKYDTQLDGAKRIRGSCTILWIATMKRSTKTNPQYHKEEESFRPSYQNVRATWMK